MIVPTVLGFKAWGTSWILKRNLVVAVECEPTSEPCRTSFRRHKKFDPNRRMTMTKIKTLSATVLLAAAFATPVFAQDAGVLGTRYVKPDVNSVVRNSESLGMSNSEMTEPGDFAVTDGLSGRSRFGSSMGHVAPGTSNAPCGNCGGE
jgi:hypothetical protein